MLLYAKIKDKLKQINLTLHQITTIITREKIIISSDF